MGAYQIVILTAGDSAFTRRVVANVRGTVAARLMDLGLGRSEVRFLSEADVTADRLSPDLPAVALYVSDSNSPAAGAALDELLAQALFVLPVVSDSTRFRALAPESLHRTNGIAPEVGDTACDRLAEQVTGRLFEELRLLRRRRRAFLSYKRSESTAVADQLHEALERRRYEVFLDTFSVDYGSDFQSALFDAMAHADVAVLLNTRTAFSSAWVEQEISRANVTGVAVLQLIWPDLGPADRPSGTEFAEPMYLVPSDFEAPAGPSGSRACLADGTLRTVVTQVERLRARAQATRRRRVVAELKDCAARHGGEVSLEQSGLALLSISTSRIERLSPVVGPPDATVLHDFWKALESDHRPGTVLYDALGILGSRAEHLSWLNQHLPPQSLAIQDLESWLKQRIA